MLVLLRKNPSTFRDSQSHAEKAFASIYGHRAAPTPTPDPTRQPRPAGPPVGDTPPHSSGLATGSALVKDERGAQGPSANDVPVDTGHTHAHAHTHT